VIAEKIGIGRQRLYTWFKRFPEIKQAVKEGRRKELVDQEEALKKSGLGYTVTLKKPMKLREEKQKAGEGKIVTERIQYVEEEVYYPPNVAALIFYLKNRDPEHWRDKPKEVEIANDDPLIEMFKRLDDEANQFVLTEETEGTENANERANSDAEKSDPQ